MKVSGTDMAKVETVLLDGMDVTAGCREASEREGWAIYPVRRPSGASIFDSFEKPIYGKFLGRVEITMRFEHA